MSEAVNLVNAYMTLIPTMQGVQGAAAEVLAPLAVESEAAGKEAGSRFSGALSGGVAKMGATIAAGGALAGAALVSIGSTFQELETTIRAATGASGAELEGLIDVAKQVGASVPAEFSDIGPVVAELNQRLDLSGATLEKVASQYLEAGRVLGETVDIEATARAFNAFGISGDEVAAAMDTLFRTSQATGVGMSELADMTGESAAGLQKLGFSFADTVALAGSLSKAGLDAAGVMDSMSEGLVTLAQDGEGPQAAFERVTAQIEAFIAAGDQAGALNLATEVFGEDAALQFVSAVEAGTLSLGDMQAALGATGDTILGVGDETKSIGDKFLELKNRVFAAIEPIATKLFDLAAGAMDLFGPALTASAAALGAAFDVVGATVGAVGAAFAGLFDSDFSWLDAVTVGLGLLAAALLATKIQGLLMAAMWGVATIATNAMAIATGILNAVMALNPIVAIIALIALLVGAFVWLWQNVEGFRAFFVGVWEALKTAASAVVTWLTVDVPAFFAAAWEVIKGGLASLGEFFAAIWASIQAGVSAAWSFVRDFISNAWSNTWAVISNIGTSIGSFFSGLWSGIVSTISGAGSAIVSAVSGALSSAWGVVQSIGSGIASTFSGIWQGIVNVAGGILNTLKGVVSGAINAAIGAAKGVINAGISVANGIIGGINLVIDGVNMIPGVNIAHVPKIPYLAEGAFVDSPTLAVVGEAGPEIVAPEAKMRALLDEAVARGGGDAPGIGGGLTVIQNITHATVPTDAELVDDGAAEARLLAGVAA